MSDSIEPSAASATTRLTNPGPDTTIDAQRDRTAHRRPPPPPTPAARTTAAQDPLRSDRWSAQAVERGSQASHGSLPAKSLDRLEQGQANGTSGDRDAYRRLRLGELEPSLDGERLQGRPQVPRVPLGRLVRLHRRLHQRARITGHRLRPRDVIDRRPVA